MTSDGWHYVELIFRPVMDNRLHLDIYTVISCQASETRQCTSRGLLTANIVEVAVVYWKPVVALRLPVTIQRWRESKLGMLRMSWEGSEGTLWLPRGCTLGDVSSSERDMTSKTWESSNDARVVPSRRRGSNDIALDREQRHSAVHICH
ncbi:hypothetical protein CY34DRAFT_812564 [Suillus luteus UH-Slu-Lm8-n1]|uniref:Uncharacterized protein n=1 Tax=Suillus luteus UH-Slu-Lm8-n1 TaxID=930992 RepID=A0A0D0ASH8_9AGAM|nr:hypothetical protein CY34DRAFT_812564 [Suillus luteus UH-Slu-Lm8-n1]